MSDLRFYWLLLLPGLLAYVIGITIGRTRISKDPDPIKRCVRMFRFNLISVGIAAIALWFVLPVTPVLMSFGYPNDVGEIENSEKLLKFLQDYNRALVRTIHVLAGFIFIFVWWFLTSLHEHSKTLLEFIAETKRANTSSGSGEGSPSS